MYLDLFKVFFRIGVFTIGGLAMLPLIEAEVVNRKKKKMDYKKKKKKKISPIC